MTDETEILALLQAQGEAIARGDAAAVVAPIAPDAVSYDLPPPLEYRGEAARDTAGLEQWFATWEQPPTVTMDDPQMLIDGDLAVVFGLRRMRGTKKDEGPLDQWSRWTIVLQRRADGWRIVHEHGSFPMLMDGSGKAATDLQPEPRR